MKTIKKMAAQGDVVFLRVDAVPDGCTRVHHDGPIICGHSETGHHHAVHDQGVTMWADPTDPMICYLRMDIGVPHADVVHLRSYDTHETLRLLGGDSGAVWQVRRQREHTPDGWRAVMD